MAKPILSKFSGTPQEVALFNYLQELSALEEDGAVVPDTLKANLEKAMAIGGTGTKTTPKLMPVDQNGNPLSIQDTFTLLQENASDIESLVQKLAYVEDPNGFTWVEISKLQTGAAGGSTDSDSGVYGVTKSKANKTRVIASTTKEANLSIIESLARDFLLVQIDLGNLPPVSYSRNDTYYGVDYIVEDISPGTDNSKVFVLFKLGVAPNELNVTEPSFIKVSYVEVSGYKAPKFGNTPLNIEHSIADANMPAEAYYRNALKFRDKVRDYAAKIEATSSPEAKVLLARIQSNINKAIAAMEENLQALKLLTKMIGEEFPEANAGELLNFYKSLVREGTDLGFHVVYRDKVTNSLQYRRVQVSATLQALLDNPNGYFFGGRAKVNQVKGNIEKYFKDSLPRMWARRLSPSIMTSIMMAEIAHILGEKPNPKFLKKNSKWETKEFLKIAKATKLNKKLRSTKGLARVNTPKPKSRVLKYSKSYPKNTVGSSRYNPIDILRLINSRMKNAVVGSMVLPALQNRTGRFASSVKAVGLTEDQTSILIDFIYAKSPYKVFARNGGKSPWNAVRERDPEYIIFNAIEEIRRQESISIGKKLILREQ